MKWTEGAQAPEGKHTSNGPKCGNKYIYQNEGQGQNGTNILRSTPRGAGAPGRCAADGGQARQRPPGVLANEPDGSPGLCHLGTDGHTYKGGQPPHWCNLPVCGHDDVQRGLGPHSSDKAMGTGLHARCHACLFSWTLTEGVLGKPWPHPRPCSTCRSAKLSDSASVSKAQLSVTLSKDY